MVATSCVSFSHFHSSWYTENGEGGMYKRRDLTMNNLHQMWCKIPAGQLFDIQRSTHSNLLKMAISTANTLIYMCMYRYIDLLLFMHVILLVKIHVIATSPEQCRSTCNTCTKTQRADLTQVKREQANKHRSRR